MSTIVSWNGSSFTVPATGEENWGGVTKVDGLLVSLALNGLQKTGGAFTLSADVDFGSSAGLKSVYYKSRGTVATAGIIRLAKAEGVAWLNNAGSGNNTLTTDNSDNLTYNGVAIASSAGVVPVSSGGTGLTSYTIGDTIYASGATTLSKLAIGTVNKVNVSTGSAPSWALLVNANVDSAAAIAYSKLALTGAILNADINASAAIAYSKLALTGAILNADLAGSIARSKILAGTINHVVINDGSGNLSSEANLAISRGGTSAGTKAGGFDALAPTTTKGDTIVSTGSTNVRQAIGTDGQVLVADSSQTNGLKWTTLSQGAKNYITYNNFENNATTGWSLSHTTLSSLVPNQASGSWTAASGSLAFTATASGPLAGTYSGQLAWTGTTSVAGDMLVSQAYTIDTEDQAKVMTFKFYYSVTAGASLLSFAGTSANSYQVYIYDVTNSTWIQPAGVYGMTQSSGVGYCTGTFQTPSNMTQFRLAIVCVNASSSGSHTILVDDFSVGPQTAPYGPVVTDFGAVSWTPTGAFNTNTTYTGSWRRVGDCVELQVNMAFSGAPNAVQATINLPSGMTIDTSKLPGFATADNGQPVLGTGSFHDVSATSTYKLIAFYGSTTSLQLGYINASTSATGSFNNTAPVTIATGDNASISSIRIPIVGWSSNVQMSNDTDTRVVACRYELATGSTISNGGSVVAFGTKIFDTHGTNVSAGVFTAPVSGYYRLTCNIVTVAYAAGAIARALWATARKNSSAYAIIAKTVSQTTTSAAHSLNGSVVVPLNAGDTLDVITNNDDGATTSSATQNETYISIERLSGPAVVAATESVNCRYTTAAGQSIANASNVTVVFGTKVYDTHGAFNSSTGVFTAPTTGKYSLRAILCFASAVFTQSSTSAIEMYALKNGSNDHEFSYLPVLATATMRVSCNGSTTIQLNAGDTLAVAVSHGESAARSLLANATLNWVAIERVGN